MPEFKTGAVRSNDAENYAYYLISPIGWRRLALTYNNFTKIIHNPLSKAIEHTTEYLSGYHKEPDNLALACLYLFEYMGFQETNNFRSFFERPWTNEYRYDLINPIGLRRLAETYKEGAIKYTEYNCEKGMPIHDLLNHSFKHIYDYIQGKRDEDEIAHASWGYFMSMHSEEMWPELNKGYLRSAGCELNQDILDKINEKLKKNPKFDVVIKNATLETKIISPNNFDTIKEIIPKKRKRK